MQAAPPPNAQVLPDVPGAAAAPRADAARPARGELHAASASNSHLRMAAPAQPGPQTIEAAQDSPEPIAAAFEPPRPEARPEARNENPTVIPRRVINEGAGRSRAAVPWIGIVSWLLLCGALFASLLGWPDQTVLDRVAGLWSGAAPSTTVVSRPQQGQPQPAEQAREQAMNPATPPARQTLPPTELAPPIRTGGAVDPAPDGPPLPRFKPSVDPVAAEFSNAFFEMGERMQQKGDFDAALHMRRQGSNLDPWKTSAASEL